MSYRNLEEAIKKGKLTNAVEVWNKSKKLKTPIDIHYNNDELFMLACTYGHIKIAKWLYEISKEIESFIDINIDNDKAFRLCCKYGHIKIALWLYEISDKIDIHAENDNAFISCCMNGHLMIAKWLFKLSENMNSTINIHMNEEYILRRSCHNNDYDIVKWLLDTSEEINSLINIHVDSEYAFRVCCPSGNITIINLLLEFSKKHKSPIDVRICNDYAFIEACKNDQVNVVKILCSLCDNYWVKILNNRIIDYKVLSDETVAIKVLSVYRKIMDNIDNSNMLQKYFQNSKSHSDEVCTICFSKNETAMLNFRCKLNGNMYDHCYCMNCFFKWYWMKEREKKCVCCYAAIDLKNCVLVLRSN
jgi:ankyrin repeat protein